MSKKYAFSLNEVVVYPGQGVGKVTDITKKEIGDETIEYFVIYLSESDMTVLVPVSGVENMGIRRIVTKAEAEKTLEFLSEEFEAMPSDWKTRYQMSLDLYKSGDIKSEATVVRSLYHRSKVKELPIQERKLYDATCRIFQDELAAALGITKAEVETIIHSHLEPLGADGDLAIDGVDLDDDDEVFIDDDLVDDDLDDDFDDDE